MLPVKEICERGQSGKLSPPDKPLPSLPIATVQTGSPIVRRSLIDASEKPLRRSTSPSPSQNVGEEWPTLSPSQPTTPNTSEGIAHGVWLNQAQSAMESTLRSKPELGHYDHQHGEDHRGGAEAPTAPLPTVSQGQQEAPDHTIERVIIQEKLASEPMMGWLEPGQDPPTSVADGIEPLVTASDEPSTLDISVETTEPEVSPAGAVQSASNGTLHPLTINNFPSSQGGRSARASRLPTRLSTPGPVRTSSGSRRSVSGRSSLYNSAPARAPRGPPGKHAHHFNSAVKPADRANTPQRSLPMDSVNVASDDASSLVTIKQSSRNSQGENGRSWIPRSRRHFQPLQDAESEGEIFLSPLPRKNPNSKGVVSDHTPYDADLKTDEGHEGRENKVSQAPRPSMGDLHTNQVLRNAGAKSGLSAEAGSAGGAEELIAHKLSGLRDRDNDSSALLTSHQEKMRSAADSASMISTCSNDTGQKQVVEKPFNRVKRLSAGAPEHGPVLRISDSAERIIMGYGSEDGLDDEDMPARKRNSVPDLRRSVAIKELRKSTEGRLNGRLPLSRSTTTCSLTRYNSKTLANEDCSVKGPNDFQSELWKASCKAEASLSDDPFATCRSEKEVHSIRRLTPISGTDWPLKSFAQTLPELGPVEEDASGKIKSRILPLAATKGSERETSSSINNDEESGSQPIDIAGSVTKGSQSKIGDRSDNRNISPPALEDDLMSAISNGVGSAPQKGAQFPPRTSSRTNTPDVSTQSRAQTNHPATKEIPNRFESIRATRLPEEFSLPKSMTVDSTNLSSSFRKLKDTGKSKIPMPPSRETSNAQLSGAKGMLSNFRGLFHKRSTGSPAPSTTTTEKCTTQERHATVAVNGSAFPSYPSQTVFAGYGSDKAPRGGLSKVVTASDALAQIAPSEEPPSPDVNSDDFHQASDLAVRMLDAARIQRDPLKRAGLLQVSILPSIGSSYAPTD